MIFRFRTVWNTDISSLFRWSFQTCIIACSVFNQLSWLKRIILNSCVKNVPMKQFTIVLEKCFSKCLDGASNADRGNPVYSQDKSAPAWPIHTPSSTVPYIQHTKYKKTNKWKFLNTEFKRLFGFLLHPFSPPLFWVSHLLVIIPLLCFFKCFFPFRPKCLQLLPLLSNYSLSLRTRTFR